jgi:hypothetical protein
MATVTYKFMQDRHVDQDFLWKRLTILGLEQNNLLRLNIYAIISFVKPKANSG